jgi:hypothetical protein
VKAKTVVLAGDRVEPRAGGPLEDASEYTKPSGFPGRLPAVTQIAPALFRHLYVELLGGLRYALPRSVTFSIGHALYLIEARYSVSDMTCVD